MYKKRLILLIASSLVLLLGCTGCGKNEPSAPTVDEIITPAVKDSDVISDAGNADEAAETQDSTDSQPTPSHEGMVQSRLTNEWIDPDIAATRPIAVMIPNSKTASQYGISEADILYECNVEAGMTRLMAVFDNWSNFEKLGNIRSCRDYFAYWAFEWDAVIVHYGGPFYMDEVMGRKDTQHIDCIDYSNSYYRDIAKNDYDNAFTSTKLLNKAMDYYGYSDQYRDGYADEQHYLFAPDEAPNTLEQYDDALPAARVDMSLAYPVTNCYFIYNENTGLYERYQHLSRDVEGPHIDLANNRQLAFKNILVQNTYYEVRDQKGYLAFQCHDTTRDGWFFTNGKGIHVTWEKTSDYGATRYYDDDGNEILINTGKTMICILADGDSFTVDGKVLSSAL